MHITTQQNCATKMHALRKRPRQLDFMGTKQSPRRTQGTTLYFPLFFCANRTVVLNKHNGVLHLLDIIQLTLSASRTQSCFCYSDHEQGVAITKTRGNRVRVTVTLTLTLPDILCFFPESCGFFHQKVRIFLLWTEWVKMCHKKIESKKSVKIYHPKYFT